jgi:taurine dioxygenase
MSNAALATAPHTLELDIHPVAGRIGAEIRGVKLSADLDRPPSTPFRRRWCSTR